MKRNQRHVKTTIKKRIEEKNNNFAYIGKDFKKNVNKPNNIIKKKMVNKPMNVDLVSKTDKRRLERIGGLNPRGSTSESIFYNVDVNQYPVNLYKKLLTEEPKELKRIKVLFLISNYERKEMLEQLLFEINGLNSVEIKADYIIYDDVSSYKLNDPNFIINKEHRGKFKYWETFDEMFKYCENNRYHIYVFTPNDFLNYKFDKLIEYGMKLYKHNYIFNTLNDGRTTCWNKTKPIKITNDVRLQFFSDCGFFTNYKTLKELEFKMNPIRTRNNNISSQVGKQITNRINVLKIPTFTPIKSIVFHGHHNSLMNPTERNINKLTTK